MDILESLKSNILDVEEMSYINNFRFLSTTLLAWQKKSENKNITDKARTELECSLKAMSHIGVYVLSMQHRQREFNVQLNEFRKAAMISDNKLKKHLENERQEKI
tara:strand:- start:2940 stop:3254 length:315 start_codon:yes stop_codon:yes gene_type:complete